MDQEALTGMGSDKKFLSIICATKNATDIEKLLISYESQKTIDTEFIVIDSCNANDSSIIYNNYQHRIDKLLVQQDRSIYEAWNKGINLANGVFVCFVGADDVIANGVIAKLISIIKSQYSIDYIYGYNVMTLNGSPHAIIGRKYSPDILENYMPMAHVMSAHRKTWLVSNGGFDESYRSSGDYDFFLRVRSSMHIVETKIIFAYVEEGGISRKTTLPIYESFRAKQKHGVNFLKSVIWLIRGLAGHYARRLCAK